jgi:hypothetical protein
MGKTVVLYYDNGSTLFTELGAGNTINETPYNVSDVVSAINKLGNVDKLILTISADETLLNQVATAPLKKHDLYTILERKAAVAWDRDGEYRWAYSSLGKSKSGKNEYLLQIVPIDLIDVFIEISQRLVAEPIGAFSTSALFYVETELDKNSAEITVLSNKNGVEVHVDSADSNLYIRKIKHFQSGDNSFEIDHLIGEIRRTELYAKQQFGKIVKGITVYGLDVALITDRLKSASGIEPVDGGDVVDWHLKAVVNHIKRVQFSNLLPKKFITQKQNSRNMIVSVLVASILLFISFISYFIVNRNITLSEKRNPLEKILLETEKVKELQQARLAIKDELNYNILAHQYLSNIDKTPLGAYLTAQLSLQIPNNLVITKYSAKRDSTSASWYITIEGVGPRDLIDAEVALANFESNLTAFPINMTVEASWIRMWIENVKFGSTTDHDGINKKFYISGRVSL